MNVLITGGTGFIGSTLCSRLLEKKHTIIVLSRHPNAIKEPVTAINDLKQLKKEAAFDIVINLAGEPIADKRWSTLQKQRILSSRIDTTQKLIAYFKTVKQKPKLFISGSAIGYYGISETNEAVDETVSGDSSFASQLCQQWEATASQAQALGIRTCLLRTGIVLGKGGGALNKMLIPFKLGLGGRIGQGTQWMPWIHIDDLVGIILLCIDNDSLSGAINGTSPNPVTNQVFTKTLGKVLKRPAILPLPVLVVKLLMGQMGEELLLAGKKVLPIKVLDAGYQFKYNELEKALVNIV
ncbi:Cell division inhibitor Slr1223 (YfcH in EC), contains epimerase/dehydratase and DUF1731 domains [hydrothermal vent metagenome]|uniref:Cell division inhibitor Slr1223 (YfcH in EC), contains epimerase/dehydratase and DUF1731 domains n=1 Tax=hydrothermal vent metagenome TaxID=652676 RepID=A0A3B0ZR48_9ZZZZ